MFQIHAAVQRSWDDFCRDRTTLALLFCGVIAVFVLHPPTFIFFLVVDVLIVAGFVVRYDIILPIQEFRKTGKPIFEIERAPKKAKEPKLPSTHKDHVPWKRVLLFFVIGVADVLVLVGAFVGVRNIFVS